jgi:large subunit ribosomal protein L10
VFSESADLPDISESLTGPTGFVFGYEDVAGAAKVLSDFAKDHDKRPVFKLGVMENKILQPEQVEKIAKLPSREVLLAQLAGAFEAPMAMLATALEAKLQETAGLFEALREERAKAG